MNGLKAAWAVIGAAWPVIGIICPVIGDGTIAEPTMDVGPTRRLCARAFCPTILNGV